MRSAVRSYAREQVFLLDRARAEGRFNSPQLGPLGSALKTGARWTDEYPAWQKYANELEALLQFTKASGQFPQYLGALQGSNSQRDSALEELRVAYHLEQNGFTVTEWRPVGDAGNEGEFMVRGRSNRSVFVEVKSPGWEGELTVEQRRSGRLNYPKYINGEGGAVGPWERLRFAIDKAYKKFRDDIPNLLVVADDLFLSLAYGTELHVAMALYSNTQTGGGYFTDGSHARLGGVGIFWYDKEIDKENVGYHMRLFPNPNALQATTLPPDLLEVFRGQIPLG